MSRPIRPLVPFLSTLAALALAPAAASAAPPALPVPAGDGGSSGRAAVVAHTAARPRKQRRGGKVRAAWPRRAGAPKPDARLARWLARHVGPAAASGRGTRVRAIAAGSAAPADPLLLVRSFEIPASDPQARSLQNWSWTYDNALAVFAFLSVGSRSQAEQVLDQLRALQLSDGSFDFAYDVSSGAGSGKARIGAMAWVGLAAAAYRREYGNSRYDKLIEGVLDYVLAQRTSDGLVKGGADVSWVSTQHNLLTIGMLRDLIDQIGTGNKKLGDWSGTQLNAIQNTAGNALLSKLLVQNGPYASFVAGVGDRAVPTDVQALGALYLQLRGDGRSAQVAANLAQNGFLIAPRRTPSGAGPYSGYRPYLDAGSPDVVWSEGTFEAALALKRLGVASAATTTAVSQLTGTTADGTVAPIGADRAIDNSKWGEYHLWPTSAAASWLLINSSGGQLLYTH